ncbi:hypothetical protein O3W44_00270 [Pantoea sp. LMR881]|uniref:hypothetical protein n=1 Tax=Pantoea sp. LMR881 TaxID=3014336 RepID=UPI0022AFFC83|nr:hypothetical protein [Pantoea sp. LMR881]MCZ4057838.1 hypothetical protein [Pantoea sp. LMR881]
MMNLTEQERDVLIEYAQECLKQSDLVRDEIPFGLSGEEEMEISLFKLALASLTAEPVGSFEYYEDEDGDKTDFIIQSDGFAKDTFNLYSAPPVPAMKPVKLPQHYVSRLGRGVGSAEDAIVMIPSDKGLWLSAFDVKHQIRAAGYPVEGDE